MRTTDIASLDGKLVLVCSARDDRNPPTGRRGTLRVKHDAPGEIPIVEVELEFPQMFSTRAHWRTVTLTDTEIAALLESENYGAFTVTLQDRLDPDGE